MKFLLLISLLLPWSCYAADDKLPLQTLLLPKGFSLELLARVPNVRALAVAPSGTIYAGSMQEGKVYAITRANLKFKELFVVAKDYRLPLGVAFKNGDLYFSSINRIYRLPQIEENLRKAPKPEQLPVEFLSDPHHGGRYIAFGPDGKLYAAIGAPCNICEESAKHSNIVRMNPDGSGLETYALGIRNSVGFDWHPLTKEFWFTDNGRDWLGDDSPPCELNRLTRKGQHFGFPYCHGNAVSDPEFGKKKPCKDFTAPARELGAHVAPLGMAFYSGKMFPPDYQNQIFVAEHGSWNRSKKSGYRISVVRSEKGSLSYENFTSGWLGKDDSIWGRPVAIVQDLDGSLLISDDHAGAIYRISYRKP